MPIRDEPWPHGTPSLLTLTCPDPRATAEMYANLFGWQIDGPQEGTGFVVASVLGRPVAAFLPGPEHTAPDAGEHPETDTTGAPEWTTHLVVDDIYVAMATARGAGAQMSDPIALGEHGRMTLGRDAAGARLGLWEPTDRRSPVAEPGTLLWSELLVRDVPGARRFYDILLDAHFEDVDEQAGFAMMHTRDGELVAAISEIGPEFDDVPPHWMPYLDAEDVDEVVELAAMFGIAPLLEPDDGELGRIAILQGPAGELFALLQPADDDTADMATGPDDATGTEAADGGTAAGPDGAPASSSATAVPGL